MQTIEQYIASQLEKRQSLLSDIHVIIRAGDTTVSAIVEPMMGKKMIVYKCKGTMKYALASVKKHISLHLLPMYISPVYTQNIRNFCPPPHFKKAV